jgi:hypothetical protein
MKILLVIIGIVYFKEKLNIILMNDELSPDNLNENCGAEFV